jgi:predicted transcriptional regulator
MERILSDDVTTGNTDTLLALTADIVAAHVSNNTVPASDIPALIKNVHDALNGLGQPVEAPKEELKPAVSIRASVKPDYIVCLEDGKKLKMLKRHLMTHYQMTPEQYRSKWGLPADYPMVAPNYAEQRKQLAMKIGLGRKPASARAPAKAPAKAPARGRAKKVEASS